MSGSGISWAVQICTSPQTNNYASTPPLNLKRLDSGFTKIHSIKCCILLCTVVTWKSWFLIVIKSGPNFVDPNFVETYVLWHYFECEHLLHTFDSIFCQLLLIFLVALVF